MTEGEWLAERFEEHRPHLRTVAYRMLGSLTDAEDALQEAWVRVSRAGTDEVQNLGGRLTTVVARVCLNMLRTRTRRREQTWDEHLPDPIVTPPSGLAPEQEVILADSVGLALQVVLEALSPAERLTFVLHDMFDLSFEEIAPMVGRTPGATRQLASRARRRVRGADLVAPDPDVAHQRKVVEAFFAAARDGDLEALVDVLHPDVVLRTDFGGVGARGARTIRGVEPVAKRARLGAAPASELHPALVNGTAGAVVTRQRRPFAVMAFTVADGRIVEIDILADPERVARVAAPLLPSARD